jgi:hypothetical protein
VILLSYAVANISNTLAMLFYWPREVTLAWFVLRLVLIPFNAIIIFVIVKDIHKKLIPFFERYTFVKEEIKA